MIDTELNGIACRLIADAVAGGRLPTVPTPESLTRIAAAIRTVTASPTKNKTAEAAPASAIKEAIICAEPTDNDSSE